MRSNASMCDLNRWLVFFAAALALQQRA